MKAASPDLLPQSARCNLCGRTKPTRKMIVVRRNA